MTVTVDLGDPDTFAAGPPHAALAELRRTSPVMWQPMRGHRGFWAVLRHADVVDVARRPEVFSASAGGVVLEDLPPDSLEMMRHMLLAMDPPQHQVHRKPMAERFTPAVIGRMEQLVRTIVRAVLSEAGDRGEVDLVHDVAARVPSRVIGELMGLPAADIPRLQALAETLTSDASGEGAADEDEPVPAASIEMALYAIEFAARRRIEEPRDDLTSLILTSTFDGVPMSDLDFGSFFVQLVTAGNDTTKTMLSAAVDLLVDHPDALVDLRADRALLPTAVEEVLRYANPLHSFRRTALVDTEVGGQPVAAGDKVAMYYTSANRDEAVFDHPQRFDIRRHPNPHLSFGIGNHFCLGVHLARLEGRVFLDELLDAFPVIERAGDPVRVRSNLNNGLSRLPVRLG